MVRAQASHMEGLQFEPDSMPWLDTHSLFTQQQMGTQWEQWGDKDGEERNWPPYLICWWLSISVLSSRHSPAYKSIWDYLYFYCHYREIVGMVLLSLFYLMSLYSYSLFRLTIHKGIPDRYQPSVYLFSAASGCSSTYFLLFVGKRQQGKNCKTFSVAMGKL